MISRREVVNSSVNFAYASDTWRFHNGIAHRDLHSGELWDIGPVSACAAYSDTSAAMRSLAHSKDIPEADVLALVEQDELRKLFTRTDIDGGAPAKTLSAAQAMAILEARRVPQCAAVDQEHRRRLLHLHARRMAWH
jgi:hypothetical protein